MLFEGLKERGSIIIVPLSAVDSMNLDGVTGLATVAKTETENSKSAQKSYLNN